MVATLVLGESFLVVYHINNLETIQVYAEPETSEPC